MLSYIAIFFLICVCGVISYVCINRHIRHTRATKLRQYRKQEFEKQIESVGLRIKNEMELQRLHEEQSRKKTLRVVKGIFAGHDEVLR